MARTRRGRGPPAATAAAAATQLDRSRAAPRKKKPYKIVLEAVTQEKRKLKSAVRFEPQLQAAGSVNISTDYIS